MPDSLSLRPSFAVLDHLHVPLYRADFQQEIEIHVYPKDIISSALFYSSPCKSISDMTWTKVAVSLSSVGARTHDKEIIDTRIITILRRHKNVANKPLHCGCGGQLMNFCILVTQNLDRRNFLTSMSVHQSGITSFIN